MRNRAKIFRDSKYELMRIIAMLLITINHVPCSKNALISNIYFRKLFFLGGKFGVDLFVIIGAWFLTQSNKWTSKGIIKIISQCVFYSLFLDLISYLLFGQLTVRAILSSFNYWFCFGYVFMLLFRPLLFSIPEKGKLAIAGVGGGIAGYITILGYVDPNNFLLWLVSKGIIIGPIWFSYIYIIVFLMRKHWNRINSCLGLRGWALIFAGSYIFMYICLIMNQGTYIRDLQSPVCLISAIGMFGIISNLEIGESKIINEAASCTFGMYLLQTHQIFQGIIWKGNFNFGTLSEKSPYWPVCALIAVPIIFAATYLVDILFKAIENVSCIRLINNRIVTQVDLWIENFYHM